jgi:hypothetical protein
MRLVF